jgi:hypothetical protein
VTTETTVFPVSSSISFLRAECTDLWNDGCGWSTNCCWVRRKLLVVPSGLSHSAIARRVKRALDIVGMPVDSWSGSDFSWRSGCVGAYADFV